MKGLYKGCLDKLFFFVLNNIFPWSYQVVHSRGEVDNQFIDDCRTSIADGLQSAMMIANVDSKLQVLIRLVVDSIEFGNLIRDAFQVFEQDPPNFPVVDVPSFGSEACRDFDQILFR